MLLLYNGFTLRSFVETSDTCLRETSSINFTVCTGPVPHNCCYKCAKAWAGNQIDGGASDLRPAIIILGRKSNVWNALRIILILKLDFS